MVGFRPYSRRHRLSFSTLLLALFVSVAVLSPLLHHDVLCHLQSPTHCTTCLISSAAEDPSALEGVSGSPLVALGPAPSGLEATLDTRVSRDLSGRSPPVTN